MASVMLEMKGDHAAWAREHFAHADLGDTRRTLRLVRMAAQTSQRPSGKISEVFEQDKERQGAYDMLESGRVDVRAIALALGKTAAVRAARHPFVFVAVDGSSISLVNRSRSKDFGSVGSLQQGASGLKVISALGISPDGVPVGLFDQCWWARTKAKAQGKKEKQRRNKRRKDDQKETHHWLQPIKNAAARANDVGAKLWYQLDREGDCRIILLELAQSGHRFTVRSSADRLIDVIGKDKPYLRHRLQRQAARGHYAVNVTAAPHRRARVAHMVVRWADVMLRIRNPNGKDERKLAVTAVWAREQGTCPAREKPLDWLLLTNAEVHRFDDAKHVIFGYTQRWRIEEFHKTWKSGACQVELTQIRRQRAVTVWATILAAVATRIERLKALSRTEPNQPASVELTPNEIQALILLKRQSKKRNEIIARSMPSIGQATLWIAELGGYTGKSSGGPPGSITIRRGLERLRPAAQLLEALQAEERSDQC